MKRLPLPVNDTDDDRVLKAAARKPELAGQVQTWSATYASYRQAGSDPWQVNPGIFPKPVHDALYALYDTRKNGGPIRRIRRTEGLLSCPLCGSGTTGSLDHLLPRAVYPEFSIMRANLVPACAHCNSSSKGNKHRGQSAPERFIHPYFDDFADDPIWRVQANPPYAAATFDAVAEPGLPAARSSIVAYHLKNVLGFAFQTFVRNLWSTYPREVSLALAGQVATPAAVSHVVAIDLDRSVVTNGVNGWRTAFLRGASADAAVVAHITAAAAAYPQPVILP